MGYPVHRFNLCHLTEKDTFLIANASNFLLSGDPRLSRECPDLSKHVEVQPGRQGMSIRSVAAAFVVAFNSVDLRRFQKAALQQK